MYTLTVIIHLIVCFLMIAAILLQAGKGAEIGAAFGGSSQTVFGSRGPGTFLSKVTVGAAIIFMLTSLSLAMLSKKESAASAIIDFSTPAQTDSTPKKTETPATAPAESPAEPTQSSSESTETSPEPAPASAGKE
ncbi:MAG: preprotein translocase subunit SecG [Nitrospirales bacterium]|nr:preprotein translocase subunit SecG [Nitrospira sp.]MDR4500242.1 preprotein translocase subunit SecG [Nitrospirales bacterium]